MVFDVYWQLGVYVNCLVDESPSTSTARKQAESLTHYF